MVKRSLIVIMMIAFLFAPAIVNACEQPDPYCPPDPICPPPPCPPIIVCPSPVSVASNVFGAIYTDQGLSGNGEQNIAADICVNEDATATSGPFVAGTNDTGIGMIVGHQYVKNAKADQSGCLDLYSFGGANSGPGGQGAGGLTMLGAGINQNLSTNPCGPSFATHTLTAGGIISSTDYASGPGGSTFTNSTSSAMVYGSETVSQMWGGPKMGSSAYQSASVDIVTSVSANGG